MLNSSYSDDSQIKTKIPHSKVPDHMEHRVFHSLLMKCIVQLELIQTIDNIVFLSENKYYQIVIILEFKQILIELSRA